MEITIDNIVSSMNYETPNKPVEMLTFYYHTANGYRSSMIIKKADYDPATIGEKLKDHCGPICQSIGTTIKL